MYFLMRIIAKKTVAALYERYPQWKDKKIVLFAPTFRGSGNKTAFYPMERFPIDLVMNALPLDTVLLVKQHPFVHSDLSMYRECDFADRLFDLTGKENINDLLFITDLLVTDYSSSIFEAALIDIPMIFYAFDLEEYLRERDLYFDFAEFVPGEIVEDLFKLRGLGADEHDVAGGTVHVGQTGATEFPNVAQAAQEFGGVVLTGGLSHADSVEVSHAGEHFGLVAVTADNAAAVTEHAHDAAVLPVRFPFFYRRVQARRAGRRERRREPEIPRCRGWPLCIQLPA